MKRKHRSKVFLEELRKLVGSLKKMKPEETQVLSISANYGNYELVIGPQKGGEMEDEHSIEINGEIHHLFVTPDEVRPHPSKNQVVDNLKDTVIMRGLELHLRDPMGDGEHLSPPANGDKLLNPKEFINLAGPEGQKIIEKMKDDEEISLDTYRIVQQDILKALKENKKKSLESTS